MGLLALARVNLVMVLYAPGASSMKRVMLTAGPTNVPEDVIKALGRVDCSHRDAVSMASLAAVRSSSAMLLGGGDSHLSLVLASSGTGANEALVRSVDGGLLVLVAGRYSWRILKIAERVGVRAEALVFDPWEGINPERVDAHLASRPDITDVFVVHLETTTGVLAPLAHLGDVVRRQGRRLFVDAISSAFGHAFDLSADGVTACTVTPNKCLEGVPGLALVLADEGWLAGLENRSTSYYFDLWAAYQQQEDGGTSSFTVSTGLLASVEVALARVREEGIGARATRYRELRDHLRAKLMSVGIPFCAPTASQDSNIITVFACPDPPGSDAFVASMAEAGFVVHSHRELLDRGQFGVATMGVLERESLDQFVDILALLRGVERR
jgi:2-aminoethylphosphonate-pyruvate transaminase